jgi:hypothetical protein
MIKKIYSKIKQTISIKLDDLNCSDHEYYHNNFKQFINQKFFSALKTCQKIIYSDRQNLTNNNMNILI